MNEITFAFKNKIKRYTFLDKLKSKFLRKKQIFYREKNFNYEYFQKFIAGMNDKNKTLWIFLDEIPRFAKERNITDEEAIMRIIQHEILHNWINYEFPIYIIEKWLFEDVNEWERKFRCLKCSQIFTSDNFKIGFNYCPYCGYKAIELC